jgi:hypothetical protein
MMLWMAPVTGISMCQLLFLLRDAERRVEEGGGGLDHVASLHFPSPLNELDVPISGIRLSDWLHRTAHGGRPLQAGISR